MTIESAGNPVYTWQLFGEGALVAIDADGNLINNTYLNPTPFFILPATPEPLTAMVFGITLLENIYNTSNVPYYAIARSGNVYYISTNSNVDTNTTTPWSFVPAGNVGFEGVLAAISPNYISTPLNALNPSPTHQLAPVVVGAQGKAAIQVGQDPATFMTYWKPLVLTPDPAGDDLVAIYP